MLATPEQEFGSQSEAYSYHGSEVIRDLENAWSGPFSEICSHIILCMIICTYLQLCRNFCWLPFSWLRTTTYFKHFLHVSLKSHNFSINFILATEPKHWVVTFCVSMSFCVPDNNVMPIIWSIYFSSFPGGTCPLNRWPSILTNDPELEVEARRNQ